MISYDFLLEHWQPGGMGPVGQKFRVPKGRAVVHRQGSAGKMCMDFIDFPEALGYSAQTPEGTLTYDLLPL